MLALRWALLTGLRCNRLLTISILKCLGRRSERGDERRRKKGMNIESSTYDSYEAPAWIRKGVSIDV